ncbi:MAG: protein-disulfide reductase DsbD family protein [Aureliella sp.]
MMTAKNLVRQTGARFSLAVRLPLGIGRLWVLCALAMCCALLPTSAWAQKKSLDKGLGGGLDLGSLSGLPEVPADASATSDQPIAYAAEYTLAEDGKTGQLRVTATLEAPWHTYSVTQPPGGPLPTKITVPGGLVKLTKPFESDSQPLIHQEDVYPGVNIEEHAERVVWTAPFDVVGKLKAGESNFEVVVDALVCTPPPGSCLPVKETVKAKYVASLKQTAVEPVRIADSHADVAVYTEPAEVKPGSDATLVVSVQLDDGYHIYPFVEGSAETNFRTLIVPKLKSDVLFGAPATDAEVHATKLGAEEIPYHMGKVEWRIPIRIPSTVRPGEMPVEVLIGFMTCTDQACDPPAGASAAGNIRVVSAPGGEKFHAFQVTETPYRDVAKQPNLASWVDFKAPVKTELAQAQVPPPTESSLGLTTLLAALAGGFILNFMPCVLPVIGLKVLGFVEQAGSDRSEVVKLNVAYVLGILAVMWVLAGITVATKNAFGWGQQFTLMEFKLAMAGLVFAMALSFLGVWEIPIPGFATSYKSSQLMQREGVAGAFAKGLLTTILATPCSGPFLGFVFAVTLTQPPLGVFTIYTMVGLGMGLPFLVLCLRPSLVRKMPKPGPWMETLKEALAFPLLLTVIYFVASIGEEYRVATLSTLIAVWFACWLIGKVPAYALKATKLKAWSAALASIAIWGIVSFTYLGPTKSELPWQPFSPDRLATLRSSGKTVMIDFTANWCLNCQWNTLMAIEKPRVAALVEKNAVVPLLADRTEPSEAIDKQIASLGSATIPLLAIYPPGIDAEPIVLKDVITEKMLLEALKKAGPSQLPGKMTSLREEEAASETR